jgi:hypothetical protein|tara:strand:+ start:21324 stop:21704 length:381 start_codon:yes stop_codon:yes gene_type:complete
MEFFIRKNSLEPILKMQIVQDGRNDFKSFHDKLSNSSIYFSMKDEKTGIPKILNKAGGFVSKNPSQVNAESEYYVYYKWTKKDVKSVGRFEGQFVIYFHDDNTELIVPIREDLFINISDSFVKSPC